MMNRLYLDLVTSPRAYKVGAVIGGLTWGYIGAKGSESVGRSRGDIIANGLGGMIFGSAVGVVSVPCAPLIVVSGGCMALASVIGS